MRIQASALAFGAVSLVAVRAQDAQPDPTRVAATERFVFHSNPWLNLHHLLYQLGRQRAKPAPGDRRRPVEITDKARLDECTEAETEAWELAVEHYKEHVVARYLTFNLKLYQLKAALCAASDELPAELPYDVTGALELAMPVYRRLFWKDHDRQNREWIEAVAPKLKRHEQATGERLARALGGRWPKGRLRTDASYYANWAGAYTTNGPDHIVVSSSAPDTLEWSAFELMIHEPCHTAAIGTRFGPMISSAFKAEGSEAPERLWHALIFYTAGELTRDVLAEEKVEGFRTYAENAGWWQRGRWRGHDAVFNAHWRPFLRGETDRKRALAGIAKALTK